MRRVIMICSGNTCRSPMAAAMLQAALPEAMVSSAGLYAMNGMPASAPAIREMERRGLSIEHHTARQLTHGMAGGALLLCMTSAHLMRVRADYPDVASATLRRFAGLAGDIADPFGGDEEDYRRAADQIWEAVRIIAEKRLLEC